MGNGYCACNSEPGDVPASKCEFKVDISDNSILLNNNNNVNIQSKINDNNNNNIILDKIFPGGDNINNFFENKEKGIDEGNYKVENNLKTNNDSFNEKKEEQINEENIIEEEEKEGDEEKKDISSKSLNIEKGNEELIKPFDNFIIQHAKYIDETAYKNAINPKIKEIEDNLEKIEEDFESEIHNLKLFKKGPLLFNDNNMIYKGSWNSKFLKEGFGISIDKNGNKYTGNWKEDKFDGNGRLISINGDYYEGNWNLGNIEGYGTFYCDSKKYKYEGEFKDNKFNGKGKIIYENKNITFEGIFVDGLKEGKGVMIFNNSKKYDGEFKNNIFSGKGTFDWGDGRKYIGDWKNNNMEGKGEFFFDNDIKYKGEYRQNKRYGKGEYTHGNIYYKGDWFNNLPHGEGIIYVNNKKVIDGIFRYGKLISKEGSKNKKNSKASSNIIEKVGKSEITDNKNLETEVPKSDNNDKIMMKEKETKKKNIVPLKSNNKPANPLNYKFGFLEKIKKSKKNKK